MDEAERARRETIIIEECGGIQPQFEAFYIESIVYAAGRADDAFERFDEALGAEESTAAEIVALAKEALTHTAGLSRFFWPARTKGVAAVRGEKLRTAFGITDSSPLQDRSLRNALEHFDERLDKFLLEDRVGYFFPGPVIGDASLGDVTYGNIFRLVDPKTEQFVLFGEAHPFGPVRKIVADMLARAKGMSESGGRLTN
jgi:hypothetical protein